MKGVIVLGDGFELTEAFTTINILRRANVKLDTVSGNEQLEITSSNQIKVFADRLLTEIQTNEYDFLIIPGGRAVFSFWDKNKKINELIKDFDQKNKYIFAICAAPYLLAKNGLLKKLPYTCFPNTDQGWEGINKKEDPVVVTDKIITAKAMYYTTDFALAIVEKLLGKEKHSEVFASIRGEK